MPERGAKRLGVFLGVFTPTVLTIIGTIAYLRVGWLVAVAGLYGMVAMVLVANTITLLTALSVSSLASNTRVGVGGAYFIISRSLGLEVGGALGLPLYLSQVLAVTLNCYGLAEVVRLFVPGLPVVPAAACFVVAVTLSASVSVDLTLKAQLPVMAAIVASLVSLALGVDWDAPSAVSAFGPWTTETEHVGVFGTFAIFFPAVTGILAGVSLSGDLEDPGRAIPIGVLSSVLVTFAIYLFLPFALAGAGPRDLLLDEHHMIWFDVARWPWLVGPGLIGAVLSSAYGSVLAAPRTLQALATDRIVPQALGAADPRSGEPVVGTYLSGALALLAVGLGDLNTVAAVVTIFFLTTYAALNLVAMIEVVVAEPSFRPRLRVPWWASMWGAAGCVAAMLLISPLACAAALTLETAIFLLLHRRALQAPFGDARTGLMLTAAHELIVWFTNARHEPRNWRPNLLVYTEDFERDLPCIRVADEFGPTRGLLSVITVVAQPADRLPDAQHTLAAQRARLAAEQVRAFVELITVPETNDTAFISIAQAHGFGGMSANTVMQHWSGDTLQLATLLRRAHHLKGMQKCTVLFRAGQRAAPPVARRPVLTVWWKGLESNGDLMLLLAYLMSRGQPHGGARLRLRTVVDDEQEAKQWRHTADELIARIRMTVEADAIVRRAGVSLAETIREGSRDASVVFLGLGPVGAGEEHAGAEAIAALVAGLPDTLLVRNDGPFRGQLV